MVLKVLVCVLMLLLLDFDQLILGGIFDCVDFVRVCESVSGGWVVGGEGGCMEEGLCM